MGSDITEEDFESLIPRARKKGQTKRKYIFLGAWVVSLLFLACLGIMEVIGFPKGTYTSCRLILSS